jgi:hypothetical protein
MKTKKQEGIAQVIWYENNEGANQIDTFIRIMGKIPDKSVTDKSFFIPSSTTIQKQNFVK